MFTVRHARPSDLEDAVGLVEDLFAELDRLNSDADFEFVSGGPRLLLEKLHFGCRADSKLELVAVDTGDRPCALLVGFFQSKDILLNEKTLYIDMAVTLPAWRGKGVMLELVKKAEQTAAASGVHAVELRTLVSNIPARDFWIRRGYAPYYIRHRKVLKQFKA